jgi:hypothetical protein
LPGAGGRYIKYAPHVHEFIEKVTPKEPKALPPTIQAPYWQDELAIMNQAKEETGHESDYPDEAAEEGKSDSEEITQIVANDSQKNGRSQEAA